MIENLDSKIEIWQKSIFQLLLESYKAGLERGKQIHHSHPPSEHYEATQMFDKEIADTESQLV